MHTITAHISKSGKILLQEKLLKKICGKDIKIILEDEEDNKKNIDNKENNFWYLLENGPKIEGPKENISREWIHDREEDDARYR